MKFFKLFVFFNVLAMPLFAATLEQGHFQTPQPHEPGTPNTTSAPFSPSIKSNTTSTPVFSPINPNYFTPGTEEHLLWRFALDAYTYGFYNVFGASQTCPQYDRAGILKLALKNNNPAIALEIFQLFSDWKIKDLYEFITTAYNNNQETFLTYLETRFATHSSPGNPKKDKPLQERITHLLYYIFDDLNVVQKEELPLLFYLILSSNDPMLFTKFGKNYGTLLELLKINKENFHAMITFKKNNETIERTFLINRKQAEALIQENKNIKRSCTE